MLSLPGGRGFVAGFLLVLAGTTLLVLSWIRAAGADTSGTVTVQATVAQELSLTLNPTSGSTISFGNDLVPSVGTYVYTTKQSTSYAVQATVNANVNWSLTERGQYDGGLYRSASGDYLAIRSRLDADGSGGGGWSSWTNLTTTAGSDTSGSAGSNQVRWYDYEVTVEWTDDAGDYQETVTYTLSAS